MRNGIVRQIKECPYSAAHTEETYSHLWHEDHSYTSAKNLDYLRRSIEKEYPSISDQLPELFSGKPDILDLGCGAGYSAYAVFGSYLNSGRYPGVDLSNSVEKGQAGGQVTEYRTG